MNPNMCSDKTERLVAALPKKFLITAMLKAPVMLEAKETIEDLLNSMAFKSATEKLEATLE